MEFFKDNFIEFPDGVEDRKKKESVHVVGALIMVTKEYMQFMEKTIFIGWFKFSEIFLLLELTPIKTKIQVLLY